MHISDAERLILANQYQLMAKLEDSPRFALLSESLRHGHTYLYDQDLELSLLPVLPQADEDLVLDILLIYSRINESHLPQAEASDIPRELLNFPGFEPSSEARLFGFANDLARHHQYPHILGKTCPQAKQAMFNTYRKMIGCWSSLGEPNHPLDLDTIKQILNAAQRS